MIWCDLRGLPKDQQRALVQPYITAMQLLALALMISRNSFSAQTLVNVAVSLPALVAGAALGVILFRKVNDTLFRSAVLVMLLVAGFFLAV